MELLSKKWNRNSKTIYRTELLSQLMVGLKALFILLVYLQHLPVTILTGTNVLCLHLLQCFRRQRLQHTIITNFFFQLELFGKSLDNVTSLIGDNVSTNKALADLCEKPLIGCASHRFNLAVKVFLSPREDLIAKVNKQMGKLKNLKSAGKLRKFTDLRAKQKNGIRGSNTAEMLQRYKDIREILGKEEFTSCKTIVN